MRKYIIIGLFIHSCSIVFGQTSKLNIGIELGPSLTYLRGNQILEEYNKPTFSYCGGFGFYYRTSEQISLAPKIIYERKGSVAKLPELDAGYNTMGTVVIHSYLDYIIIPILINATFGKYSKLVVNAGPFIGYLLKGIEIDDATHSIKEKENLTRYYKKIDTGISCGIGLLSPINSKSSFKIELKYNLGLQNVSDAEVINNGTIKTNSLNLTFGFVF